MKTRRLTVFLIAVIVMTSCNVFPIRTPVVVTPTTIPSPTVDPSTSDLILTVGHGAFIGPAGKELVPDVELIRRTQNYHIENLLKHRPDSNHLIDADVQATQRLIENLVDDEILARALFIDWLIEKIPLDDKAQVTSLNNALRWYYYLYIKGEPHPVEDRWSKGINPDIAEELEKYGIPAIVFLKTDAGGREYLQECRNAGVPVPNAMFSNEWELKGIFDNEFISESRDAELWFYASDSPAGVCLALPRYPAGTDQAVLLGIICLGTQTNKSCFFDNPAGRAFSRGVEVSINEFVGGVDLVANDQGVCSDCHAGENPFVVHPEKPPFAALPSLQPGGWPDPLVDASWPQNPGPTNLLYAVASTGKCDSCHRVGLAGRFPEVSNQLPGYCNVILETAMGSSAKSTMPPFGADKSMYAAHINALRAACGAPPPDGGVIVDVDLPDDEGFISPPIVIGPLYQCATQVAVRGAILDASVELYINGVSFGARIARNPNMEEFTVPDLVAGDIVTATQEYNGVLSLPSEPVTVGDHTVDFPAGLPAPDIDPTLIYECAEVIAVRNVPGATITVYTNGTDPASRSTSTDWSAIFPGKRPFDIGDSFTASAELCGEVSPLSAAVSAVSEPATIPAPMLNPPTVYEGQELVTLENLVNGSHTSISELSFGLIGEITTPVSWFPDYDIASKIGSPLSVGDSLFAIQRLCREGPEIEIPPAESCEGLPAPRIRNPLVGDDYVVVTESVPGARIRIYDGAGDEIGDGSGLVIMLKRALTGADTIIVVQQLGECTSTTGYLVNVSNPGSVDDN